MADATQTIVNQVGYNPAVAPYLQENMGQARALTYNYKQEPVLDANGQPVIGPDGRPVTKNIIGANGMPEIESFREPEQYGGERQAEFSDLQMQAMQGARDMVGGGAQVANQNAQDIMRTAANTAAGSTYTGGNFGNQYTAPANLGYTAQNAAAQQAGLATLPTGETATAATMGRAPTGIAAIGQAQQAANAPQMTAQAANAATLGAAPEAQQQQFAGPRDVSAERVGAERINAPNLRDMSMTAAKDIAGSTVESRDIKAAKDAGLASLKNYQMGPAERVETKSFAQPGSADAYMSPYMQSVVGIQQREAQRAADIASTGRKGEQTRAGAFGGSRAAIMDAEAARNLATQQGDIQAQGLQEAYKQAQQQFNTEQSQGLQAQTANQQAGLTVGQQNLAANLGVQQLGEGQINLQTRLANLNNEQQAAVQNESNRLQAQGLTAGQAMQAALANQGVQQQANVQNLSAGLQTQGLGAQTGLQAQQSNQQYNMQGQLANQQTGLAAQQANQGMGYNTAMQNAQLRQQTELANQGQRGQYGMQQGQFNQAANLQTSAQAQEAQRQNQAMAGQYGLANLANRQQTEQANTGYQQQTGMANQALAGQYGMQQGTMDQQAAMQTAANRQAAGMYGAQAQNERAQYNATNQQQTALANQAAGNRASEFGAGQGLTSAGTAAQYGQAANQLNEQSGQFGANFGLQGQQAAMQGATGLSNIAGQGYNQGVQTNQLLAGYGNQQQNAEQQRLSTQYQDFLNEQNMPYKQLGFMANTASAAPTANLGSTMYQATPSAFNQIAGLGTAAAGAFGAAGGFGSKANGGMVGRYAKGGLVRSRPQGLVALAIHSMA